MVILCYEDQVHFYVYVNERKITEIFIVIVIAHALSALLYLAQNLIGTELTGPRNL